LRAVSEVLFFMKNRPAISGASAFNGITLAIIKVKTDFNPYRVVFYIWVRLMLARLIGGGRSRGLF